MRAPVGVRLDDRRRRVGRAVVDDDDLRVEAERVDAPQDLADRRRLVVRGDEERDADRAIEAEGPGPDGFGYIRPR
ncbi:MAG: hypothetical protein ACLGI5_08705 [Thermoleophilia bacterium]